jgi:hypothetical protein
MSLARCSRVFTADLPTPQNLRCLRNVEMLHVPQPEHDSTNVRQFA